MQIEPIKLFERIQRLKDQIPKYQKEVVNASALEQVKLFPVMNQLGPVNNILEPC